MLVLYTAQHGDEHLYRGCPGMLPFLRHGFTVFMNQAEEAP